MKTITQHYVIHAPLNLVWKALIDPLEINAWGGGPAKISDKQESFSLWGGDIHGKNLKVVKEKELQQEWYSEGWKDPSLVTFILAQKGSETVITLHHENIPDEEATDIADGWNDYYLGAIKKYLES